MEDRSSISSSDGGRPSEVAHTIGAIDTDPNATGPVVAASDHPPHRDRSSVPWALLLSLIFLAIFEAWLHLTHWPRRIPYQLDQDEYYAVAAALERPDRPDIAIIGSSRAREGVDVPVFRGELLRQLHKHVSVINYGVSGGRAYVLEAITRDLLRAPHPPHLIILGGAERDLGYENAIYDEAPLYWDFHDWHVEFMRRRTVVLNDLPTVIRHWIGRVYFTLRYREQLNLKIRQLLAGETDFSTQLDGGLTPWQRNLPKHSLAAYPASPAELGEHVKSLASGIYPDPELVSAMDRLAQACRSKHVRLIVFQVPISSILRQYVAPGAEAEYAQQMSEICARNGALFLGPDQFQIPLTDRNFRDPSHLNLSGAKAVSLKLAQEIVQHRIHW